MEKTDTIEPDCSELVNFSVTPAEEGASGFVTAVAAR